MESCWPSRRSVRSLNCILPNALQGAAWGDRTQRRCIYHVYPKPCPCKFPAPISSQCAASWCRDLSTLWCIGASRCQMVRTLLSTAAAWPRREIRAHSRSIRVKSHPCAYIHTHRSLFLFGVKFSLPCGVFSCFMQSSDPLNINS